jgi:cytochrome P450
VDEFATGRAGDQEFTLVLGHDRLRRVARDWTTYTSATPFRVPIPEESELRPVRQYPIETDPPEHGQYRRLIDHRFSRSAAERIRPTIERLADELLRAAVERGSLAVVDELAIPIVTTAIAETMGLPADAERLRSWGLHVFRDPVTGRRRRNADLDAYLAERVDRAIDRGGDDIFCDLACADLDGRRLTRDEILGYGYLVLAGGRDTVIAAIAGALWHLAAHPAIRVRLGREPGSIATAVEEYLRYVSPLGYIGRTVTVRHEIDGRRFEPGDLVGLCFAAANRDPREFEAPDECRIDRRPNRHVAFGHGPHTCIGAPLARMELTVVIDSMLRLQHCEVIEPETWSPRPDDAISTSSWVPHALRIAVG